MHDIRAIRADAAGFDAAMARRGVAPVAADILAKDTEWRAGMTALQENETRRNALAKQVGEGRRRREDTTALETEARGLLVEMERVGGPTARREREIKEQLALLPNILDADVPDGRDETANIVLKQVGESRNLGFVPKQHFELGEALRQMEFERAAKIAGSRFTILRGLLAQLERALGQFMIDLHTREHGYEEVSLPLLVNDATMYGTGQLPKFFQDLFLVTDDLPIPQNRPLERHFWLIPTAEVPLTNLVAGEMLAEKTLPLRLTALTDCFRAEAGAAGRDTRGMLRQHQFRKVELVSIARPEDSEAEHERMTECAERVLELLEIPYRRVVLCAGDTGFSAAKTYDLEVWLPGQRAWREISSCSNCRAFQARRMNARFRATDGKSVAHVHTLNGSGVAVGRALIAVMENFQEKDGSILVPPALRPWMSGVERIGAG